MGKNTPIEWATHTFNTHWGCTEAKRFEAGESQQTASECARCYARTFAKRVGFDIWGDDKERRFFGDKHWNEPLRWDRKAAEAGERRRVFCASMADVFEDRDELNPHRARLWELIAKTPNLDWLLLTKRPQNMVAMAPAAWSGGWPANVWAGASCGHPDSLWRLEALLRVPARVRFASVEPLTARLDPSLCLAKLHWVIVGGESGPGARPMHPQWVRDLRDQCVASRVAFHFKQWGEWLGVEAVDTGAGTSRFEPGIPLDRFGSIARWCGDSPRRPGPDEPAVEVFAPGFLSMRVGKKAAGRLLDGREWNELPEVRG